MFLKSSGCFDIPVARVESSYPDVTPNVGAKFNRFLWRRDLFTCNRDSAPALTKSTEFGVRGHHKVVGGPTDGFLKLDS